MDEIEFKGILTHGLSSESKLFKSMSKEQHTKNNKSQKCKISNDDRLANLKLSHKSALSRSKLISDSLQNIDHNGNCPNKKIKFDSSDDESADFYKPTSSFPSLSSEKKISNTDVKSKDKKKLFEDDDSGNSDNDNDYHSFEVPAKYKGKAGIKLMNLQSKFSTDSRFKMNERFLDDFKNDKNNHGRHSNAGDNISNGEKINAETAQELNNQMNILEKVLGKPVNRVNLERVNKDDENSDDEIAKFKPKSLIVRYDPTNPQHYKYRKTLVNPPDVEENKKSDDSSDEHDNKPVDNLDKNAEISSCEKIENIKVKKGYKMDSDFAERLRKKAVKNNEESNDTKFSLLATLGRPLPQNNRINGAAVNETKEFDPRDHTNSKKFSPWQIDLMQQQRVRKDSDSSDSSDKNVNAVDHFSAKQRNCEILEKSDKNKLKTQTTNRFFFYPDDPRFTECNFYRTKSMEIIEHMWEKKRMFLVKVYKRRRKNAVRQMNKKDLKGTLMPDKKNSKKFHRKSNKRD